MKCTYWEFVGRVKTAYPDYQIISEWIDPIQPRFFSLPKDIPYTCYKNNEPDIVHAVANDILIIDKDGLFNVTLPPIYVVTHMSTSSSLTNNIMINGSYKGTFTVIPDSTVEIPINVHITTKNCECGAHKVGSANHSDWCQMKGLS